MVVKQNLIKKYYLILLFIPLLITFINSQHSSALTYQDNIDTSFTINSSVSISLSSPQLIISELPATTYATSNIITLTAASNNATGYVVTATAGDGTTYNTTDLVNTTNSSLTFGSLATDASYDIASNDFAPGKWGYTYCNSDCSVESNWINATSGTGYSGLPLIGNAGAEIVSTSQATSTTTEFKIGAKATSTQLAGDYRNQVNFTITANPLTFCDTHTCMQDLDSTSIASLLPNVGDTATVYDNRDEQAYAIAKLADNKYWMLDNLALDLVAKKNDLTEDNTNASSTTLGYLKNGGGSGQYTGTAVAYAGSTNTYDTPQVAVSGTCDNAYCVNDPASGQWTSSSVTQETINGVTSIVQGKIGAYYNYCAASAGSYCYASGSGTGNATEDICPKGWRLPTGGSSGEYNNLYSQYSGGSPSQVAAFQTALATPLSGRFFSGTARYQGNYGYFWSSTYSNGNNMYYLSVNSSNVTPSNINTRNSSASIRCVLSS